MANKEHLKTVLQGAEAWNRWRELNPEVTNPDLSWADLSKANLSGGNFRGVNLSWANLSEADLSWSFLNQADLTKANLSHANLSDANLYEASLHRADLSGAQLYRAYLVKAHLEGVNFREANLEEAVLNEANLQQANFRQANLTAARLIQANLTQAILDETVLIATDFSHANLFRIETVNVDFKNANLFKANFKYANPARRKLIIRAMLILLALALLWCIYLVWKNLHADFSIIVPGDAKSYVYLNGEFLSSPLPGEDGSFHYRLQNYFIGDYDLKVYAAQLADIDSAEFTRFKLYQARITISRNSPLAPHLVRFDTLYTVKQIARGLEPGINPEGSRVIYFRAAGETSSRRKLKQLYLYDIATGVESPLEINTGGFPAWDLDWEIDEIWLFDRDRRAYLSAYRYSSDRSYLFGISLQVSVASPEDGTVQEVPLDARKKWLSFVPLPDLQGVLVENRAISLRGETLKKFAPVIPYQEQLFYGGNGGVVFVREEKLPRGAGSKLSAVYAHLESGEIRELFPIYEPKIPSLSASEQAQHVALCSYSGMTLEFFSTIKLWSNNRFVDLVPPLLDGDRSYRDGRRFHKTEIAMDREGRNIVYEYESSIYLLRLYPGVTFDDLTAAERPGV